jgi:hypothetical protein
LFCIDAYPLLQKWEKDDNGKSKLSSPTLTELTVMIAFDNMNIARKM